MNLFQTNFLAKMAALLKEAFKFKKYRAMHPVLAVFTGILMIPLVIISFALTALVAAISFAFAVLSAPVKYLHGIVNNEGKEVKHATQTAIYLISWPLVFALYAAMSAMLLVLLPAYAALSIVLFAWSLGGFKFHLFPNSLEDISIEVNCRYFGLPLAFVIVGSLLVLFIPMIHGVVVFVDLWVNYAETLFPQIFFNTVYPKYIALHTAFSFLYSVIGFANREKKLEALAENNTDAE